MASDPQVGPTFAAIVGVGHEVQNLYEKVTGQGTLGQTWKQFAQESLMDLSNKRFGRTQAELGASVINLNDPGLVYGAGGRQGQPNLRLSDYINGTNNSYFVNDAAAGRFPALPEQVQPERDAVGLFQGFQEVSSAGWRLLALGLGLIALAGCGGPDERLVELDARIKALDGRMKLGEVREVPLPPLKPREWVVAINGQYVGSVCEPSPLSKEASLDASNYGGKGYPAFLLLVVGSRVRSDFPLSLAYTAVSPPEKSRWTCALIAGPTDRALVVECMKPVSDKAAGRACKVVLRAVK